MQGSQCLVLHRLYFNGPTMWPTSKKINGDPNSERKIRVICKTPLTGRGNQKKGGDFPLVRSLFLPFSNIYPGRWISFFFISFKPLLLLSSEVLGGISLL